MAALDGSLADRINLALKRSREPSPSRIARRLQRTLTEEEKAELIYEALEDRVYNAVHRLRSLALARTHREDTRLREERWEKEQVERKAKDEQAWKDAERMQEHYDRDLMRNPIRRAQKEVADRLRKQVKLVSLSSIYEQRVCVDGTWLMFENCTEEQVRALADEYVERAVDLGMRSAYYRAIADTMAEGGFSTVGEMCKGIGLEAAA